jgi:PEP-CTERM motif
MTRTRSTYLALLAVLLSPMAATADVIEVTIDFDSAPLGGFTSFTEDGFTITQFSLGDPQSITDTGGGNQALVDGNPFNVFGSASVITILGSPGTLFDLISLDIADLTNNSSGGGGIIGSGFRIEIGNTVFSPTTAAVYSPTSSAFSTVNPTGLTDLSSLAINIVSLGGSDNFAVDNVVLRYTEVPEPGTLALFGIGLLGMGLARRRRKV